jgi:hypothetical protein
MDLNQTVTENAIKNTSLLVDSQLIDPWLITIDFKSALDSSHQVRLYLGLPILIFELQQCDTPVDRETILSFVRKDIDTHKGTALNGYLTIARAIIRPRPTRKRTSWFARVFTAPPRWIPPEPKWEWTGVDSITIGDNETLLISGFCREHTRHT